jgi:transposase
VSDLGDLPDDIDALKAALIAAHGVIAVNNVELDAARADVDAARAVALAAQSAVEAGVVEIEHLHALITQMRRKYFGKSSEKLNHAIEQLELRLEDLEETQAERGLDADAKAKLAGRPRPPRKPGVRKALPEHLPREIIVLEPETNCACCTPGARVKIGEDVSEILETAPAQHKVIRYVRPKYVCRACETIVQAPAADLVISKGMAGPGLIADIAISKYCDGAPLYRQSEILARSGIEISRAAMAEWMGAVAWWTKPIYDLIKAEVMRAPVLHTDDTPVKVLAPGTGKTATGRLWVYLVDEGPWRGPRPPAAYYRYSPDRKGARPQEDLADFSGYLQADAYAGYDKLTAPKAGAPSKILHVACMAHARRKFFEAFENTKSPIAAEALKRIQDLYAIEREINETSAVRRLAMRQDKAVPLLANFEIWMQEKAARISAKTETAKALYYALERWDALARYASDGRLAIDNNPAERALRTIAVSRKNFLFLGSDEGGRRAAIIYTLAQSAKLNGLNPHAYLAGVLGALASGHSNQRLSELTPWAWAASHRGEFRAEYGVHFTARG